jgi:protocatechuate 3,4-dioxygenase beta subunit
MRGACLLALLLWIAAGCARSQQFSVAGRVVDAISGSPVGHAAVAIEAIDTEQSGGAGVDVSSGRVGWRRAQAQAGTVTGADGRFVFSGLAAGRYRLSAARRGYLEGNLDEHAGFFAALLVGPDEPEAARIVFPLRPAATIEGTVLDSSGDPVPGASATLFMQTPDGAAGVRQVRSAYSQPNGSSYAFDGLAPGTYYVAATGHPWFAASGSPDASAGPLDVAYALTFYPNGASTADAQPIVVKAGDTVEADFSLSAVPAVHLVYSIQAGVPLPALGVPAFDGTVRAGNPGIGMGRQEQGQERGTTMDYSVAPGSYVLVAGSAAVNVTADTTLPGPAGPTTVVVAGRVAMADGSAILPGLTLRLVPDVSGRGAGRFLGGRGFGERPVEAAIGTDGSFRAAAVPPGEYRLAMAGGTGEPLMLAGAAASGGQLSETLGLHVGADPVMLAATIARANGAVSGRVVGTDGAPAAGVMVLLVPQDGSQAGLYRQEESDSDGTWTLRGVAAGAYTVVAIQDGWDLAWRTPAVIAGYLRAGGEGVVLAAGGLAGLAKDLVAEKR